MIGDRLPWLYGMSEFGRPLHICSADGRDQYPAAWSAVLAGGGVLGGQAYGSTNEDGSAVAEAPVSVSKHFATLAKLLSMDPARETMSPIAISDSGKPINELIAAKD